MPSGPCAALSGLAAEVVTGFDRFRAPPTEAELARRRRCRLTDRQEALLDRYGYPYVLEEFRFHLTLTGATQAGAASRIEAALRARMTDLTAAPFVVSELCLFGEGREDGRFRIIERFAMPGARKDRAVETGSIRKGIRTCEG